MVLKNQVELLKADLEQAKVDKSPAGELSKSPILVPTKEEV